MPVDTRTGLEVIGVIPEGGSRIYSTVLKDTGKTPPEPLPSLSSCLLTRINARTRRVIGVAKKNVLNANGGVFVEVATEEDSVGTLKVTLGPADNVLEDQRKREEYHILHFDYAYNDGATEDVHEVMVIVRNLAGHGE